MIAALINKISQAARILVEFLAALFLAIIAGILYALPWLFRVLCVLSWLAAAFISMQTIKKIYSPISQDGPTFVLQSAAIVLLVAWAMVVIKDGRQIWGGLMAGGLTVSFFFYGAGWLSDHWQYANLFFAVLPPALFAVGMIAMSVRLRARRLAYEPR